MSRPLAEYTPYESDEETGDEKTEELGTEDESGTEDEYVAEEDPNELRRIRQARDARYALIRAPTDGPLLTDEPLPAITRVLRSNIINTPHGSHHDRNTRCRCPCDRGHQKRDGRSEKGGDGRAYTSHVKDHESLPAGARKSRVSCECPLLHGQEHGDHKGHGLSRPP